MVKPSKAFSREKQQARGLARPTNIEDPGARRTLQEHYEELLWLRKRATEVNAGVPDEMAILGESPIEVEKNLLTKKDSITGENISKTEYLVKYVNNETVQGRQVISDTDTIPAFSAMEIESVLLDGTCKVCQPTADSLPPAQVLFTGNWIIQPGVAYAQYGLSAFAYGPFIECTYDGAEPTEGDELGTKNGEDKLFPTSYTGFIYQGKTTGGASGRGTFRPVSGGAAGPSITYTTVTVAADDSHADAKAAADYVCDASGDQITIKSAIDSLNGGFGYGKIQLAPGTYYFSNYLNIDEPIFEVLIEGSNFAGPTGNINIRPSSAGVSLAIYYVPASMARGTNSNMGITGSLNNKIIIDEDGSNNFLSGILASFSQKFYLNYVEIYNCQNAGVSIDSNFIWITNCNFNENGSHGCTVQSEYCSFFHIDDCEFNNNTDAGLRIDGGAYGAGSGGQLWSSEMDSNGDSGIIISSVKNVTVYACDATNNGASGIYLNASALVGIYVCDISGNNDDNLVAQDSYFCTIQNCDCNNSVAGNGAHIVTGESVIYACEFDSNASHGVYAQGHNNVYKANTFTNNTAWGFYGGGVFHRGQSYSGNGSGDISITEESIVYDENTNINRTHLRSYYPWKSTSSTPNDPKSLYDFSSGMTPYTRVNFGNGQSKNFLR